MKLRLLFALPALLLLATAVEAADKTDLDKMQGDWKIASAKRDGKDAPPEIKEGKMNVSKNTFTMIFTRNGAERKDPIDVKLNEKKSPKQLDFVTKDGTVGNHGIYKLEGNKLTICFARARDPRPTKFESTEGSKAFLMVLEKAKK